MKNRSPKTIAQVKSTPIKTTVMEMIESLSNLTNDDALVVATMKNIFASYQVRLARTLAPVRLVNGEFSVKAARRRLGKRNAAWA
jgi:hypothetical protein